MGFCPVPHAFRDQVWISVGGAIGLLAGWKLCQWLGSPASGSTKAKAKGAFGRTVGILTGISYVSGLDYYKGINEKCAKRSGKRYLMPPNPDIILSSVDCDQYANMLVNKDWDGVEKHLVAGTECLSRAQCDIMCIASNTGHIAFQAIKREYPNISILHIADCTAKAIKARGVRKVGLLGTEPTMSEGYLKERLALHGIDVIVPSDEELPKIFKYIMDELGFNVFKGSTRQYFTEEIEKLQKRGAGGVILGCTEIELLVNQEDVPDVPLFPSAELHIDAIAEIITGTKSVADYEPK